MPDLATPPATNRRLAVLISGRGSNLQALIDAIRDRRLDATLAVVISNVESARGLERARHAGVEGLCLNHRDYASRDEYDQALVLALRARNVALVCLAGFMRRVGTVMLDAYRDRILNIHPSLLPAFPGIDAQRQAIEHGVRVSGVTVHLVNEDLDGGPIIVQRAVPVLATDTPETLAARILVEEHLAYPDAVRQILDENWRIEGRRFIAGSD
jgi:phosphoribosylglycinamide formyltransferase-1